MDDLISRQMAIDELTEVENHAFNSFYKGLVKAHTIIADLPSIRPEIIYCKDCKHFVRDDIEIQRPYGFYDTYFFAFCDKHWDREQGEYIDVKLDDFCSFAERRTDE